MAAVKLEQYLTSILDASQADTNEVPLRSGNHDFDLLAIALENHNMGVHRYQTSTAVILYAAAGSVNVKINGQDYLIKAGNIILLQSKCNYEVQSQDKGDLLVKIEFGSQLSLPHLLGSTAKLDQQEKKAVQAVVEILNSARLLYIKGTPMSISAQLVKKIIDEYLSQNLFTRSIISAELNILLVTAIRSQNLVQATSKQFASSALEQYIDDNFANITLDKTAKHFGFNPNYFSSLVKQKTGKSFVEHVDERRMEEARQLLARPDISVKEIISRVGYTGKSFFYKKFSEYYHETPVQMRAELFRQANINLK